MLQRLPLDISTFREMRKSKYLYVDKTQYAYELIIGGRRYFLSRPRRFGKSLRIVVRALHKKFGRVAILIDEYDSPILNALHDQEQATKIRDTIKGFFAAIKSLDAYINFVFITGVSSFTRAGLFSGINNLQIITLDNQFSGICGYTDQEVDHYFPDYIQAWAEPRKISPTMNFERKLKNGITVISLVKMFQQFIIHFH